jgi:hypothetical protein
MQFLVIMLPENIGEYFKLHHYNLLYNAHTTLSIIQTLFYTDKTVFKVHKFLKYLLFYVEC